MESNQLKPCPFCGHEDLYLGKTKGGNYYVVCFNCHTSSGNYMKEEMAVEAWNRREK